MYPVEMEDKRRSAKRTCRTPSCSKWAVRGGHCIAHGGQKVRSLCTFEGCSKCAVRGGICIAHGAKRKSCSVSDCPKNAKGGGFCIAHGGKSYHCKIPGCFKQPKANGVCISHGARRYVKWKQEQSKLQVKGAPTTMSSMSSPDDSLTVKCVPTVRAPYDNCHRPSLPKLRNLFQVSEAIVQDYRQFIRRIGDAYDPKSSPTGEAEQWANRSEAKDKSLASTHLHESKSEPRLQMLIEEMSRSRNPTHSPDSIMLLSQVTAAYATDLRV